MHHDPGVGIFQRPGDRGDTLIEPGEVLVAACIVGTAPRVADIWRVPGDVIGVAGLAAEVDDVGDTGHHPLVEHPVESVRIRLQVR